MTGKPIIPYEEIGAERLSQLVDAFYARVAAHPKLQPIFPNDLSETARKQKQFLTQYLGGPNIYSEEHGHPRLKARHNPFAITPARAQAWLECMSEAMDEVGLSGKFRETLYNRLVLTAHHMINASDSEEELE
ncbi:globin [Planococcus sp. 4-30]|uniref:globin domain-containing protein n=1 Tax=Planococcus TaxID=1372 RepID=UPI001CC15B1E|nr:globin [Planococcus sp. 4-30]